MSSYIKTPHDIFGATKPGTCQFEQGQAATAAEERQQCRRRMFKIKRIDHDFAGRLPPTELIAYSQRR
jgi:hypothetical protein